MAREAERLRKSQMEDGRERTRVMFDTQLAELHARRKEEAEQKMRDQAEAKEHQRRIEQEDLEAKIRQLEAQAQTRKVFSSQVQEVHEQKRIEEQQRAREARLDRSRLLAEERAEADRLAALDKANA